MSTVLYKVDFQVNVYIETKTQVPESEDDCNRGVTSVILTSSSFLSGLCTLDTSIQ